MRRGERVRMERLERWRLCIPLQLSYGRCCCLCFLYLEHQQRQQLEQACPPFPVLKQPLVQAYEKKLKIWQPSANIDIYQFLPHFHLHFSLSWLSWQPLDHLSFSIISRGGTQMRRKRRRGEIQGEKNC